MEDLVAATAYLELFLRSVSEPGLLCSFVRFLLEDKFDGERILDHLVQRVNSKTRVSYGHSSVSYCKYNPDVCSFKLSYSSSFNP